MQIVIGTVEAEVSEDGRDVRLPAPAAAQDALVLQFLQEGHSAKPLTDLARRIESDSTALVGATAGVSPRIDFETRLVPGLVLCVIIAVIATKRFLARERVAAEAMRSSPWSEGQMDEFVFLKRYGGATR